MDRVLTLIKGRFLSLWTSAHNSRCESCDEGGDLVLCSFCNCAWHDGCLKSDGGILAATRARYEEDGADWPCKECFENATTRQRARSASVNIGKNSKRTRIDASKGCDKSNCNGRLSKKKCFSCKMPVCLTCTPANKKRRLAKNIFCGTCSMNDSDEEPDSDEERAGHEE